MSRYHLRHKQTLLPHLHWSFPQYEKGRAYFETTLCRYQYGLGVKLRYITVLLYFMGQGNGVRVYFPKHDGINEDYN